MKRDDGVAVSGKEVRGVWMGHFKHLMTEETTGKAIMLSMSMEVGGKQVSVERERLKERM